MKKFLYIFLIILSFSNISKADTNEEYDYQELKQGELAPFDGILFTYDGIAKSLARVQNKNKLELLEKEQEYKKISLDLETNLKQISSEYNITKIMLNNELNIKQKKIDALTNESYWNTWKLTGGFLFGLALGVGVTYLVLH